MSLAVVALVALMVQTPPPPPPRKRADPDMRVAKREDAERTMQLFADCLVARKADMVKVDELMRQPSEGGSISRLGNEIAKGSCMPRSLARTEMRLQPALLRASLFDARYRRQFARQSVDITAVAPLIVADEFDRPPTATDIYSRRLGDCVSRKNPTAARALVLSRSGSDAEAAAIAMLRPSLGECVSANDTLRLSRTMLRGVVGEALYKLSLVATASADRVAGTKN